MEKDFETQVLTRLAVIESKIDDYKSIKEISRTAYTTSNENAEDIKEINEKLRWITRLISGSIITAIISLAFAFIQK